MSKGRQSREGILKLLPVRMATGKQGRQPIVHGKELGGPKRREKVAKEQVLMGKRLDEMEPVGTEDEEEDLSRWRRFFRSCTRE